MVFSSSSPRFSSRGASLYLDAFTKVVPFDDTMAAATIRADQDSPAVELPVKPVYVLFRALVSWGALESCIFDFNAVISISKYHFLRRQK